MPTLEEIQDESVQAMAGEKDDDAWKDEESDIVSEISSDDEDEVSERGLVTRDETIWQRIAALKDIVPSSTRESIKSKVSTFYNYSTVGVLVGGRLAWVVTTTALLVGLPYALAVEDEMRVTQQERDMISQQQGAQSMIGPAPGSQGSAGIRPPGF
ncbi:hypothetical protein CBS101457_000661 [Exobasidium rhododendri]|nr:hypothetical protein CBS101457_000661 [Exobasidium rhododendri]